MKKILILALSLVLVLGGCTVTNTAEEKAKDDTTTSDTASVDEKPTEPEKPKEEPIEEASNEITFNVPFEFDNLEITLFDNYTFDTVSNQFSDKDGEDVILIPATIKNISDETHGLNMFYFSIFGSQGTKLGTVDAYFENTAGFGGAAEMRSGATAETTFALLYDGDGDYYIEFDNFSSKVEVRLPITK